MKSHLFGHMPDGAAVQAFSLRSSAGLSATIAQYGARIAELLVPAPGGARNVTLGFDRLEPYLSDTRNLGAVVGRYGNRIGGARFTLDGREYRLPANDGHNTLHGGPGGFSYRVWQAEPDGETLRLTLHSADGDQGFPGALDAVVEYRLDGAALIIDYAATANAPTVVNLTNHAYFNLSGEASVLEHRLRIPSSRITALNAELIPTGEIRDIAGTPLDFRTPTAIGARIALPNDQLKYGGGYDLNYVLADAPRAAPALAATLSAGGLVMTMLTTEPGLQFYSGNFLNGVPFARRSAVCLQGQHYTDSLNHPAFPTTVLRPGERFASRTVYRFDAG
jgi:aldose 1-epimerase